MTPIEDNLHDEFAYAGEVDDGHEVDSMREGVGEEADARGELVEDPADVVEIEDAVRDALGLDPEADDVTEDDEPSIDELAEDAGVDLPMTGPDFAAFMDGVEALDATGAESTQRTIETSARLDAVLDELDGDDEDGLIAA